MPPSSRTFRIFVSSTFSDLKAERGALQERVFPRLRALAAEHGCRFQVIDLRWGVSEEAALDQQTMKICLGEIERCQKVSPRPNFVILLGNRYGWRPLPYQIPSDEFHQILAHVPPTDQGALLTWYRRDDNALPPVHLLQPRTAAYEAYEAWEPVESQLRTVLESAAQKAHLPASNMVKYTASATEQEIVAGALQVPDAKEHVFCFLRDIQDLPDDPSAASFRESDPAAAQKQADLKAGLRQQLPGNVHEYQTPWQGDHPALEHLDQLCEDVFAELSAVILTETGRLAAVDPLDQETAAHTAFAADRARVFVGRADILTAIEQYLGGSDPHPLAVWGVSGSGKSALMAKAIDLAQRKGQEVLYRFIGATPPSSSGRALLESLCQQISRRYGADETTIPSDYKDLVQELPKRLALATPAQPLILFLDALDQLSDADNAHRLTWLPAQLPPHVRLVLSTLPGECLLALESKTPPRHRLEVQPLAAKDGEAILDAWLTGVHRSLQPHQKDDLLEKFADCGLPLYLKLAYEEARLWKSYDPLVQLSPDIPGLLRDLFQRLSQESNHGGVLVSRGLGYLAASRNGLSEDELLDVLSRDGEVLADFRRRSPKSPRVERLPVVVWSRLYFDLEPYLTERSADGTTLLAFFHRQMAEACQAAYRDPARHAGLEAYFHAQPLYLQEHEQAPNLRKLSEMIYQQAWAGLGEQVEKTLLDFGYLQAKLAGQGIQALIEDYDLVRKAGVDKERERPLFLLQGALRLSVPTLNSDPLQLPCQLTGRLLGFTESSIGSLLEQIRKEVKRPWLRPLNLCFDPPGGALVRKIAVRRPVKILPDGKRFISPGEDGIKVWDLETGECLRTLEGHIGEVDDVALTPDGRYAVSISTKELKVWDLESGACLQTMNKYRSLRAVAVTPDGSRAVTLRPKLSVWDIRSGEFLHELDNQGYNSPCDFFLTPDGSRVIGMLEGAGFNKFVAVWDVASGAWLYRLKATPSWMRLVAVTGDSSRIITGDLGNIQVWDINTGICLHTLEGHTGVITALALTPDDRYAVSASTHKMLKVWDLHSLECVRTLEGDDADANNLALTPDGRYAVSISGITDIEGLHNHSIKVWDIQSGTCLRTLAEHLSEVGQLALTPDGRYAVTHSGDDCLDVWDIHNGGQVPSMDRHADRISVIRFTPDGSRAVSASGIHLQLSYETYDNTLKVWDTRSGSCLRTLAGHTKRVSDVKITPDGRCAISASDDHTMKVWDLESGTCLRTIPAPSNLGVDLQLAPDGRRFISISSDIDKTLKVWDFQSGACLHIPEGLTGTGTVLAPDGRRVISRSADSTRTVWDLESGKIYLTFKEPPAAEGKDMHLMPSGRFAFWVIRDEYLVGWDIHTGLRLNDISVDDISDPAVLEIRGNLTPDGRYAVYNFQNETLRVEDRQSGATLASFYAEADLSSRGFSPVGLTLAARGWDNGAVYLLQLENVPLGPIFVTAWCSPARLFWKPASIAFGCPHCRSWSEIPETALGNEIACPNCGKPVKLNPFTIQGDWRPIAQAWQGEK